MVRNAGTVVRTVVGLAALVAVLWWAGPATTSALAAAGPLAASAAAGVALLAAVCRFEALYRAVRTAVPAAERSAVLRGYLLAVVARGVSPVGVVSGVAVAAYSVARHTGGNDAAVLAAVTVWEAATQVASLAVAGVGLAGVVVPRNATPLAVGVLPALALRGAVGRLIAAAAARVERVWPGVARRFSRRVLRERASAFRAALATAAGDRRNTGAAFTFAAAGWVATAGALWVSLAAVGVSAPVAVVLFVPPAAGLAGVVPTPGGIGAVDAALAGLIAVFAGADPAVATAATLVYRAATFWLPLALAAGLVGRLSV